MAELGLLLRGRDEGKEGGEEGRVTAGAVVTVRLEGGEREVRGEGFGLKNEMKNENAVDQIVCILARLDRMSDVSHMNGFLVVLHFLNAAVF